MSGPGHEAEQLFELCPDLLVVSGFDGYLQRVNPAWSRALGWSAEELKAGPYLDLVHPDDRDRTRDAADELIRQGTLSGFINRFRHRDGSYRWLSWDARADARERRMYAAVRDVTEQHRTTALRDQLEAITGVGTWELDLDNGDVYWSPICHAIHGTDVEGARPRLEAALTHYPGTARAEVERELGRLLEDRVPRELEVAFRTVDGRDRWVELTAAVMEVDGKLVRVFGTIEDVTERVEERQRLQRFRDLLELTEEGIAQLGPDGTIVYANARLARMVHAPSVAAVEGRRSTSLLHEAERARFQGWFDRRGPAGDEVTRAEVRLAVTSSERRAQVALRVQRDARGTVTGGTAVFTDVTPRVLRERKLEETQVLLEEAQTLARIGHWRGEVASGLVTASAVVEDIVGVASGSLTIPRYLAAIHPDDQEGFPTHVRELPIEHPVDSVHRLLTPSGDERTVHLRATMELDGTGRIVAMRGTLQDVTELHRTERALQRVLRATNDGWWEEDLVSGDAVYSDRWWEIHGLTAPSVHPPAGTWRRYVPQEELQHIDERLGAVLAEQHPTFEMRGHVLHSSGRQVPVVVRASIEYDPSGRPVRISGATTDVTEQQRLDRAKEVFVSTVSHELRTPLTAIGGSLELLADGRGGALPEGSRDLVEMGLRNAARLRTLIADLLDVEQLRTGSVSLHLEPGAIGPLVRAAVTDLRPTAEPNRVAFDLHLPEQEPQVLRDAERIGQVLRNLLSNAVKYAPAGSVIDVHVSPGTDVVRTTVVDRGPGLPEGFQQRAFERFAQADPDDPRSRGGTGLGLAISREIVEQHRGAIGYDSRPGNTGFWFDLPVT